MDEKIKTFISSKDLKKDINNYDFENPENNYENNYEK